MTEPVIVDLLRHGEVDAEGWAFRGATDLPLSGEGWRQMRAVQAQLEDVRLTRIATSPMQRCHDFSSEYARLQSVPLQVLDDMREMDFGAWENRPFEEIEAESEALLHRFWQSPVGVEPPGGECFDAFAVRVMACWDGWLEGVTDEHRLLVAHGGVIRVLLAYLLDMPMDALWRLHLPYVSWSRVSLCAGHTPRILFMNGASYGGAGCGA